LKTYKDKANNEVHVLNMLILVSVDDRDIIVKNDWCYIFNILRYNVFL